MVFVPEVAQAPASLLASAEGRENGRAFGRARGEGRHVEDWRERLI